jgi:uncharacterized protein (TIGR00106 family)
LQLLHFRKLYRYYSIGKLTISFNKLQNFDIKETICRILMLFLHHKKITTMNHKVNVAFQVLPRSKDKSTYELVDVAIEVIKRSGIKHRVCPFETVLEGDYNEIMSLIKKVQEELYAHGTETILSYIKIQSAANHDVTIEDKMEKYD